MKLTLDSLKDKGAFAGAPVEKEITWQQGDEEHTATVFVRRLSYSAAMTDITSSGAKDVMVAGRIASSICDEDGNPIFTIEDVTGEADPERGALSHALTMELLRVIGEVNSLGESKAGSTQKRKSGASSS